MKRKLQKTNKNQFTLTIPKSICEIKNFKMGDEFDFSIDLQDDSIKLKRVE